MTIDLNILNHLGIGLYSNIPAVLSEIVANSWDADATHVDISINNDIREIVITDNGIGMKETDINKKYLKVGYRKRESEPNRGITLLGRNPMGRKGIGKLSVFSIAEIVEVYSIKDGQVNALRMEIGEIQKQIDVGNNTYSPEVIEYNPEKLENGTKIVLKNVKKNLAGTSNFLRKRLARRFSIIGVGKFFDLTIDGEVVTPKDRDYYSQIQFLWYFGKESAWCKSLCTNAVKTFELDPLINVSKNYKVSGWIGTVDEAKNDDDLNNTIVIYAHGKLIQEDILKEFKEGGVYTKYLIGDIEAEFLDLDGEDDIVTSDRQSVKEDDERFIELAEFIHKVLKTIQNLWSGLRYDIGTQVAFQNPILKEWYGTLQGDNRTYARQLFGKIESLKITDSKSKIELYKASILAFEKLALANTLSVLNSLETTTDFEVLKALFGGIDDIEAAHYYQIVKGRIQVLKMFEEIVPESKEQIIQTYIFDHLWLLDASWERAAANHRVEQSVTKEFAKIDAGLSDEEKSGRIDIRYRSAAGKHIIIELKKYDKKVNVYDLMEQVNKYQTALEKCLNAVEPHQRHVVESICIIGSPPSPTDRPQMVEDSLRAARSRFILYDTLIAQTYDSYKDYLEAQKKISSLISLIDRLDEDASQLPPPAEGLPLLLQEPVVSEPQKAVYQTEK